MDEKTLRAAGIDYDAALARFVGRRELYEKFLQKFLEDTHEQDAVCAYRERQFEETLAQVHALKGVCGTLGLTKLYEISAEIVRELRAEEFAGLERRMEQLTEEHDKLYEAIRRA